MYVSKPHVCVILVIFVEVEEGVRSPGIVVSGSYELPQVLRIEPGFTVRAVSPAPLALITTVICTDLLLVHLVLEY